MPARPWQDLTSAEMRARPMERAVAVLPVAAVEQHGPHLPLGTDAIIAEGYLARAAALVPDDLDVLLLPVQAVGKSDEHLSFPGTLTLTGETALRAWVEIGTAVHRAGCRKLVLVTSHGGNSALIDLVALELRRTCDAAFWRSPPPGAGSATRPASSRRTRCATASTAAGSRPP
jgi:creatinine amidohydrolase